MSRRRRREDVSMRSIHILKHGLPLCGFTREPPVAWPAGHAFIGFTHPEAKEQADCDDCIKVYDGHLVSPNECDHKFVGPPICGKCGQHISKFCTHHLGKTTVIRIDHPKPGYEWQALKCKICHSISIVELKDGVAITQLPWRHEES